MTPYIPTKGLTILGRLYFLVTSLLPRVWTGQLPIEFLHGSLKKAAVVPDAYTEPADYGIEIWFNHAQVEYGNHLWIKDIQQKPTHINWVHQKKDRFTLMMTGLDAPSSDNPNEREVLYWMVGNIPETWINQGEQWAAYVPPWPLGGPGPHRIIFTVFKHYKGRKITYRQKRLGRIIRGDERKNFSTQNFCYEFKLKKPWAANFFDMLDNSTYPPIDF